MTATVTPAGATPTNATARSGGNGAAAFSGLSVGGSAGSYTLSFGATGLTSVSSGAITLSAGAATQLTLTTPPSATAQSGVALAQQPVVQLQDASGNPVSQSGVLVTATVTPAGATLTNATATTAANGAATFSGLTLSGRAGSYTLSFGATGLASVSSGAIALSASAATQFSFNDPATTEVYTLSPHAALPIVQLQDASGNPVSQSGVVVTATVTPAGATPTNATATTGATGAATFSGLTLSGSAGSYTGSVGATGLTSVISRAIALSASAATQLTLTTPPSAT